MVRATLRAVVAALAVTLIGATACAPADGRETSNVAGLVLPSPPEKPDFTLTATDGRAFDFRRETDGFLTLLFFGYTHCPDICPVHMANLAGALKNLEPEQRSRVKVVFVTTDPARDTPARMRTWLDGMDRSFIGLSGPMDDVNRAQSALMLAPAIGQPEPGTVRADSAYTVGHAAQIVAFTPQDNRARVYYPFGTRQRDWARDIPILLRGL